MAKTGRCAPRTASRAACICRSNSPTAASVRSPKAMRCRGLSLRRAADAASAGVATAGRGACSEGERVARPSGSEAGTRLSIATRISLRSIRATGCALLSALQLQKLLLLLRRQRLRQIFERDRVLHHLVQPFDLVD